MDGRLKVQVFCEDLIKEEFEKSFKVLIENLKLSQGKKLFVYVESLQNPDEVEKELLKELSASKEEVFILFVRLDILSSTGVGEFLRTTFRNWVLWDPCKNSKITEVVETLVGD